MSEWRYLVYRANGTEASGEYVIESEAPLKGVEITNVLSGPPTITASIDVFSFGKKAHDGKPIYLEWGSLIFAEDESGNIRGGGILTSAAWSGTDYTLTIGGYSSYLAGMPYLGPGEMHVQIDLCDAYRAVWGYVNSTPGAFLTLEIDTETMSGIRIGTELTVVDFETGTGEQVTFEAGPWKLSWHTTDDLGQVVDDLAKQGFEWREFHAWRRPGEVVPGLLTTDIRHWIQLSTQNTVGSPGPNPGEASVPHSPVQLIKRREDVRIVLEENAVEIPTSESSSEEYASAVQGLGAGDGPMMVRSIVQEKDPLGRLYRAKNVTDSSKKTKGAVTQMAKDELSRSRGDWEISTLRVRNTHLLDVASIEPGHEVRVTGEIGGRVFDDFVRIVSVTISPEDLDGATLSVVNPDKI